MADDHPSDDRGGPYCENSSSEDDDVRRLRDLFASGKLIHPFLDARCFSSSPSTTRKENDDETAELHPRHDDDDVVSNFTDLSAALAVCCGTPVASSSSSSSCMKSNDYYDELIRQRRHQITNDIGGTNRRHVVFILCDGMGTSIIDRHALPDPNNSFLRRHINDPNNNSRRRQLRAVFPSTTPAALTTLATATYPGQHGMPGWDLRDKKGCDYPGCPQLENTHDAVQLRVLAECIVDVKSGRPAEECGFNEDGECDDVFVEEPWARRLVATAAATAAEASASSHASNEGGGGRRRMIYVNAYNGDDFPTWYQGGQRQGLRRTAEGAGGSCNDNNKRSRSDSSGTEFSDWQMGRRRSRGPSIGGADGIVVGQDGHHDDADISGGGGGGGDDGSAPPPPPPPPPPANKEGDCDDNGQHREHEHQQHQRQQWFDTAKIGETAFDTLGEPQGSHDAITYFRDGIDAVLDAIAHAEVEGQSTFVYLYTSHPDKHMHALGVEHEEVRKVVRGFDEEIERLWDELGNREKLLSRIPSSAAAVAAKRAKESKATAEAEATTITDPDDEDNNDDDNNNEGSGGNSNNHERIDCAVIVSADHGHVTVKPDEMVPLPPDIEECLEYANVGVHGKGRHAYLHCRSGLQSTLKRRWHSSKNQRLHDNFLLLSIDEAIGMDLLGPHPPRFEVRPRLGDFVVVSVNRHTLVSPRELDRYRHTCQGAHGSLLPDEMRIPFVLCTPPR